MKNNLNAIRFILATLVIYSHSFGLLNLEEPVFLGVSLGRFSVISFFVLSGYLISKSNINSSNQYIFIYHRVLRIIPGLIVAILISKYLAIKCHNFINNPVPYINNGPVWTISWEVFCYCIVLLLGIGGVLKEKIIYVFIILMVTYYLLTPPTNFSVIIVPLILCFFIGSYFYLRGLKFNNLKIFCLLLLLIILVNYRVNMIEYLYEYIPFLYSSTVNCKIVISLITYLSLSYCILFIGFYKSIINMKNDYSYGLYLYGWPVSQIIISLSVKYKFLINSYMLFIFTMILTFICAFLSWPVSQIIISLSVKYKFLINSYMLFIFTMILTFICAFLSWHLLEKRLLKHKNMFNVFFAKKI